MPHMTSEYALKLFEMFTNIHIIGFHPQIQKLKTPYKTPSSTLAVKWLKSITIPVYKRFFQNFKRGIKGAEQSIYCSS